MPASWLIALCHHSVRSPQGSICFIVPLSCSPWRFGGQTVMLAHLAAAALRAASIICAVLNRCPPLMEATIWTCITQPPCLPIALWPDDYVAHMGIGSMVPLLLQGWAQKTDIWPPLLCVLVLTRANTQNLTPRMLGRTPCMRQWRSTLQATRACQTSCVASKPSAASLHVQMQRLRAKRWCHMDTSSFDVANSIDWFGCCSCLSASEAEVGDRPVRARTEIQRVRIYVYCCRTWAWKTTHCDNSTRKGTLQAKMFTPLVVENSFRQKRWGAAHHRCVRPCLRQQTCVLLLRWSFTCSEAI